MSELKNLSLGVESKEQGVGETEDVLTKKLEKLGAVLKYYREHKSVYISMNGGQRMLSEEEVARRFQEAPTLFHRTCVPDERKIMRILGQGLNTEQFRNRAKLPEGYKTNAELANEEKINESDNSDDPFDMDEILRMEDWMDRAYETKGMDYNKKFLSLTWIPWWNEHSVKDGKPNSDYEFAEDGTIRYEQVSIVLDEQTGREIIDKNLAAFNDEDSKNKFGELVKARFAYCEVLEPFRVAPRNFAAIFVMEGRIEDIADEHRRSLFEQFIERLGAKSDVPIFNFYGDLLWPKKMSYDVVMQSIQKKG